MPYLRGNLMMPEINEDLDQLCMEKEYLKRTITEKILHIDSLEKELIQFEKRMKSIVSQISDLQ